MAFQILVASGFKVWPSEGGLLDQDEQIVEDLGKLMILRSRYLPEPGERKESKETSDYGKAVSYEDWLK